MTGKESNRFQRILQLWMGVIIAGAIALSIPGGNMIWLVCLLVFLMLLLLTACYTYMSLKQLEY